MRLSIGIVASHLSLDVDAAAYLSAMTVQPDNTRKSLINDLIVGLKADNTWTTLDALALPAAHNEQAALINARYPTQVGTNVSGSFTQDRGFTMTSTNSNILLPYTGGGNFSNASSTIGIYTNTAVSRAGCLLSDTNSGTNTYNGFDPTGGGTFLSKSNGTYQTVSGLPKGGYAQVAQAGTVKIVSATNANLAAVGQQTPVYAIPTRIGVSGYTADSRTAAFFWGNLIDTKTQNVLQRITTYLTAIGAQ